MFRGLVVALAVAVCPSPAIAQESYPNRNVTIVVPLAAGSGTDIMARVLAASLSNRLGKAFTVENKPGANGIPATEHVARQPNDGYTLMLGGNTTHSANVHLFKTIKYDPIRDFTPVSRLATAGAVLVVAPNSNIKSMEDLIREAKANPGKLTYGAPNSGAQIASETIKKAMSLDITRVPYRATPQAMTDVIAGTITMTFLDVAAALANVANGQLRAIAITSIKRSELLPSVPTMNELGFKDFNLTYWNGLFGPAGLPRNVVSLLDRTAGEIMTETSMQDALRALGLDPSYMPAEQMPAYVQIEIDRWGNFIRDAAIEPN
ncbi:MAG: tripartite tricarboxylate transporter substrate binding protein [Hyphomicrobiales bacterium]|nr:tripartite tricarboxylate transporter substrate binding protein [Alphaproteobacteria bacterium]